MSLSLTWIVRDTHGTWKNESLTSLKLDEHSISGYGFDIDDARTTES